MYDNNIKNNSNKIKLSETIKIDKMNNSIEIFDKVVTPLTKTNPQYPPKFMEIYRKSDKRFFYRLVFKMFEKVI